ncbi:MAG: N-acetylmuramoyl-L-alanine amidase [Lachnospiraceae bacterium]|nr:N-acetylmuramoyl-L-alanine amidase [Lachnospiraceae bacterium]
MTRKTKGLHKICSRVVLGAAVSLCMFLGGSFGREVFVVNAATLRVHNYVTNDTYNYTGTQVTYYVEGKQIQSDYPGLVLEDSSALGPCKEIFEQGLGVVSDYTDGAKSFSLRYGPYTIQMTLGNTKAVVNGTSKIMPNAPVVYSFQGGTKKYLYVPTRFVAEAFGFEYTWDSAASTSAIRRPNVIYDGDEQVKYQGITPSFLLNNRTINSEFPGYVFDGCALFAAKDYFKETGIASYTYSEGSGLIVLERGDTMLRFVLDSPVAYVNDTSYLLSTVPRLITPSNSAKAEVYIPAQFAAEALGFQTSYDQKTGSLQISGTVGGGNATVPPSQEIPSGTVVPDTASYAKELFSYQTYEQVVEHFTSLGYQVPVSVSAYSCLNSDALYLNGIDLDRVRITDKQDVIEIVFVNCHNPFGGKAYYNTENAYLNYSYLFGENNFKITIVKTKELHYYSYKVPNGCVIHFTDSLGLYQDYIKFIGITGNSTEDSEQTSTMGGEDASAALLPDAVFSRNSFVIRLPEGVTKKNLTDSDEYGNLRFTICISGNHMKFLSEQEVYNPISTLKSYNISYKAADNSTVITFNTTKIQGYSYNISGGYLAVRIDDPPKIYDKIVVLDAGHGGIDPGTLRGSVYEKTVNFNVVNIYAPEYFKNSGIKVYYTRTTDTKIALETRAAFAKSVGADFFISFHVNAHSSASVAGTSVYYSAFNNTADSTGLKSSTLATTVLNHLVSEWGTRNRGILTADFVVIHDNTVPAVLVECGFITNDSDFQKIKDTAYQKKAAKALFDAVSEIFAKYPTKR